MANRMPLCNGFDSFFRDSATLDNNQSMVTLVNIDKRYLRACFCDRIGSNMVTSTDRDEYCCCGHHQMNHLPLYTVYDDENNCKTTYLYRWSPPRPIDGVQVGRVQRLRSATSWPPWPDCLSTWTRMPWSR